MVISERKVDHLFPQSPFYIKGFRLYRKDRDRCGGGVFIYVRRGLIVNRINDLRGHQVESISLCENVQESGKGACHWNVQTTWLVKSYMEK